MCNAPMCAAGRSYDSLYMLALKIREHIIQHRVLPTPLRLRYNRWQKHSNIAPVKFIGHVAVPRPCVLLKSIAVFDEQLCNRLSKRYGVRLRGFCFIVPSEFSLPADVPYLDKVLCDTPLSPYRKLVNTSDEILVRPKPSLLLGVAAKVEHGKRVSEDLDLRQEHLQSGIVPQG